jgi:hypothetical protein
MLRNIIIKIKPSENMLKTGFFEGVSKTKNLKLYQIATSTTSSTLLFKDEFLKFSEISLFYDPPEVFKPNKRAFARPRRGTLIWILSK